MTTIAPVAADELLTRLVEYLRWRVPAPDGVAINHVVRPEVGWSHETILFDATWCEDGREVTKGFCVRRDPGNTLLRDESDLRTQFRVLQCLQSTPVPAPEPYWLEEDPAVLGAPFLVMERLRGSCPEPWDPAGRRFYAEAARHGRLPGEFVQTLATLHTIDWEAAGLSFLGVPRDGTDFAQHQLTKWRGLIDASCPEPEPILTDLLCWLDENKPSTDRKALVHGAYRTGNILVDDHRVVALLDWELQEIGDPMFDVAYVLSDLNRKDTDLLSNLVPRDQFYRQYEAATGFEIDEEACRYYQLVYAMRSVAFWMSASGLYATGASEDLRLARTAYSVPVVLERAARDLGF